MAGSVFLAGGGTAGHVTPALATAAALRHAAPGLDVRFAGTARGLEARLVPAAGWPLHTVAALPLQRRLTLANLAVPGAVVRAARGLARDLRTHGAVAACVFGGYVSGPLALAARLTRTPLVIHEQNAVPGLANRLAARWASAVAVSVPGAAARFAQSRRVVVTGNPVRAELAAADLGGLRDEALDAFDLESGRRTLLVFGGSLGARTINDAVLTAAIHWRRPATLQVLHAAGARDYDRVARAWDASGGGPLRVRCVPYVERMDLAYAAADVVCCRSGASTVAELSALGRASVLVPYPHGAADEQAANAAALADAGAATVVADAALDGPSLVAACEPLLDDDGRRSAMAAAARGLGRPDAAARVAELVLAAAHQESPPRSRPRGVGPNEDRDMNPLDGYPRA